MYKIHITKKHAFAKGAFALVKKIGWNIFIYAVKAVSMIISIVMLIIFIVLMYNILILAFILTNTYIKKIVTLIVLIVGIISNSGASGEFMTIATDTNIDVVSEVCDIDSIVDIHFSGDPMDIEDPHGHLQKPYSRADATHQPAATNFADRLSETRILTRDQFPGECHHWYLAFLKHKFPGEY